MLFLPSSPIWVHSAFEMLAMMVGGYYYRRYSAGLDMPTDVRFAVFAAAFLGAALGCKIPVFLEHPQEFFAMFSRPELLLGLVLGGKSILGAILGAWLVIEGVKKLIGYTQPTGDAFAGALIISIILGRIGCLLCALPDHSLVLRRPCLGPLILETVWPGTPCQPMKYYFWAYLVYF